MNIDSSFIYMELIFLWMWGTKYSRQGHAIWPHRFTMTILRSQIDWEWQGLAEPVWSYHQKSTIAPWVQLQTLQEYVSTFLLSLPYSQPLPMSTELPFPEHTGNLFHSVPFIYGFLDPTTIVYLENLWAHCATSLSLPPSWSLIWHQGRFIIICSL